VKPGSKRHVILDGEWWEPPFEPIGEALTPAGLMSLVQGACADGAYTHQQIADWATRFWFEVREGNLRYQRGPDWDRAVATALDIDAQWDAYLVGTYSPAQLRTLDCSGVRLPKEWWVRWAAELTSGGLTPG
jgi:hypothetical protein